VDGKPGAADLRILPARREQVLANARVHGAPAPVIALLERLPAGVELQTMHEL
jgi:hypothetical protein